MKPSTSGYHSKKSTFTGYTGGEIVNWDKTDLATRKQFFETVVKERIEKMAPAKNPKDQKK